MELGTRTHKGDAKDGNEGLNAMKGRKGLLENALGAGRKALGAIAASATIAVLPACGDQITNNYTTNNYYGQQDAGGQDAESDEPDSEAVDAEMADGDLEDADAQCEPSFAPLSCDPMEPIADETVMSEDNPAIEIAEGLQLVFEAVEEHGEVPSVIVSVVNTCTGDVIQRNQIGQMTTHVLEIEGVFYIITADRVYVPEPPAVEQHETGTGWALVSVSTDCFPNMCLETGGVINQGESLAFANYRVQLDDLVGAWSGEDIPAAVLSVMDHMGNILAKYELREGDHVIFDGYMISVGEVAAGYTFGAKWAEVNVSRLCEEG